MTSLRKHLHFLSLIKTQNGTGEGRTTEPSLLEKNISSEVWKYIDKKVGGLEQGKPVHLGMLNTRGGWKSTPQSSRHPGVMGAIQFFSTNHLQAAGAVAAQMGLGLKSIPPIRGYDGATVVLWRPGGTYMRTIEQRADSRGTIGRLNIHADCNQWARLRSLQILYSGSPVVLQHVSEGEL